MGYPRGVGDHGTVGEPEGVPASVDQRDVGATAGVVPANQRNVTDVLAGATHAEAGHQDIPASPAAG